MSGDGWRVDLVFPAEGLAILEEALGSLGGALVTGGPDAEGDVPVTLYLEDEPERAALVAALSLAAAAAACPAPDFQAEPLPPTDWVAESQKSLPPIRAGRFFLHGSHISDVPGGGTIPLLIDANQAFGTGRHETTRGCLLALQDLHSFGVSWRGRALDMGCGSGVLAMAMAALWRKPVLGVDNDQASVLVARENARLNGLGPLVRSEYADGYRSAVVRGGGPYDLIVANILAAPLCAMAQDLSENLAPGGFAVLSGLLASQERMVRLRHRNAGLVLSGRYPLAEWMTLVLHKP